MDRPEDTTTTRQLPPLKVRIDDPYFRVSILSSTSNPQQLVWLAAHQDYSSECVGCCEKPPTEERAGELIVRILLAGDRGHFGCFEHPSISFSVCGYPHSVMQQARTHRVGVSFDVSSFRYNSDALIDAANGDRDIESVVYFRPTSEYRDRAGKKYSYNEEWRESDKQSAIESLQDYRIRVVNRGYSEEHARGLIPFDVRQNFVVTFNARSLLHFLDLRAKADAQLEIQDLSDRLFHAARPWMPAVIDWYEQKRLGKAKLAP